MFFRRGLLDTGGHIPKCNRAVICRRFRVLAELLRPSTKSRTFAKSRTFVKRRPMLHLQSLVSKNKEFLTDDFRGPSCYEGVRILPKQVYSGRSAFGCYKYFTEPVLKFRFIT